METDARPPLVVVMGVSGCGKTTVGERLAERLGVDFLEGDRLHPPENVARMRAGTALTDADRSGWLDTIAARLGAAHAGGAGLVVSCSALKRSYRDRLRAQAPALAFVHLQGDAALLAARLSARHDHYMPPSLLASQLATLEPPGADERAVAFDIAWPPDSVAAGAEAWLASTLRDAAANDTPDASSIATAHPTTSSPSR